MYGTVGMGLGPTVIATQPDMPNGKTALTTAKL
jgi:hypothetical protein